MNKGTLGHHQSKNTQETDNMLGARTLALLCLVCGVIAVPNSLKKDINSRCPEQNENSKAILFSNPSDCSTYYECDNGVAKLLSCPDNLYFDSKLSVCAHEDESDCLAAKDLSPMKLVRDDDDVSGIDCPEEEDNTTSVYYPNLKNCSTFYECSNGKPILLPCSKKQYFSVKFCVCVKPKISGCTQPDDDDDDDGDDGGFAALSGDVSEVRALTSCKKRPAGSDNDDDGDDGDDGDD